MDNTDSKKGKELYFKKIFLTKELFYKNINSDNESVFRMVEHF